MRQQSVSSRGLLILLVGYSAVSVLGATLTVTNTNDSGAGSLRDAIAVANSGDTIDFSATGTITLSSTLTISKDLTINGPGASNLAISGNNLVRVFYVSGGQTVNISGVTVANGNAGSNNGGGISNSGALTLGDIVLSGNSTSNYGGGIYNDGTLTLANCTVSRNSSSYQGGGIYSRGTLTLTSSIISSNYAYFHAGGVMNREGSLILIDSTVSANTSVVYGGGLVNSAGEAALINARVSGNRGYNGGGIFNDGPLTLNKTTVSSNSATYGGGIHNDSYTLTLTNSTVSGNSATYGGGIYNTNASYGAALLANSTVSGNSASVAGGIYSSTVLTLKNTIVADSGSAGNCVWPSGTATSLGHNLSDDATCASFLTATGDLNNTPAGLDPNGLQNNGGPTQTIALLSGSPAVDAIPLSPTNYCTAIDGITPIATDQRGISRPQGSACDIGAFELQPQAGFTPTGSNVSDQPVDATAGGTPVTLTFATVTQAGTTTLTTTSGGPPPPTAFKLGNPPVYYNLSTTAVFSGSVTVCVNYAGTTFGNTSKLRLFHYENNAWTDVTTSVDTTTMTICGSVTSLSPFAIFESAYTASIQSPIKPDGSSVFAANRGVIPVKFTLDLNGTITCQLPPATISLTRTAGGTLGAVNESSFSMQSDSGSNFRIDTANCQYVYNLGASALGTGTYSVQIVIGNIVAGDGSFGLK